MAVKKHRISFILEARKDKNGEIIRDEDGKAIRVNAPIIMSVTWSNARLFFYIGYRTDSANCIWIDKDKKSKIQQLKKNTLNKDNISSSIINQRITKLEATVNDLFIEYGLTIPTEKEVREKLRSSLNEEVNKKQDISLFDHFDKYIKDSPLRNKKNYTTAKNHFKDFSDSRNLNLTFDKCTSEIIKKFKEYLSSDIEKPRSQNTITAILKRLRAFFSYAVAKGQEWTNNNPFTGNSLIDEEVYGNPICLKKEERDVLYFADIKDERLARVRDIFVLQCLTGCRISDFVKLKKSNIINGFIEYIPGKTIEENPRVCKIPLVEKALTIINKYDLPDGSLVPYISDQRYNEYIKELFALESVNLTRPVSRLNPLTRKPEIVPLNTIASSHLARRTFIGLLHKKVKNETIASMSGHTKDSKAFHRYYAVDEEDQKEAMKTIE